MAVKEICLVTEYGFICKITDLTDFKAILQTIDLVTGENLLAISGLAISGQFHAVVFKWSFSSVP